MFKAELFKRGEDKRKTQASVALCLFGGSRCSSTSVVLLTRRRSHFHFGSDPASTNRRHDNARPCPHPATRSHHHTTGSTITHGCLQHRGSGAAGMRAEHDRPNLRHLEVRPGDDPNTCPARSTLQLGRACSLRHTPYRRSQDPDSGSGPIKCRCPTTVLPGLAQFNLHVYGTEITGPVLPLLASSLPAPFSGPSADVRGDGACRGLVNNT